MSELIEKRDAYHIIKDMIGLVRRDVLMDAYDALKNLPTVEPASPWHRVDDELPPKGFAFIGARKRPLEISEDIWDMWVCEYDGEWGWQDMDGYALRGITHWMPIEPPKEEVYG